MTEATYAKQFLTLIDSRPVRFDSDYIGDARELPAAPAYILPRMPRALSKRSTGTTGTGSSASARVGAGAAGTDTEGAGATATVSIELRPLRATPGLPTPLTLSVPAAKLATISIYDLKVQAARRTGYAPDKVKILWDRKPVADSKTVLEVSGASGAANGAASGAGAVLEMGVMFVGQPTAAPIINDTAGTQEGTQGESGAPTGPAADAAGVTGAPADVAMHDAKDETHVLQGPSGFAVLETKEFWDDLQAFVLQRTRDEAAAAAAARAFREAWRTGNVK